LKSRKGMRCARKYILEQDLTDDKNCAAALALQESPEWKCVQERGVARSVMAVAMN
jgi:hypothetical protein